MSKETASDVPFGFQAILPGTSQKITTSGSSQQSSAFQANSSILRLCATADCFIAFGANPTADNTAMFMPAGLCDYYGIVPGQKLAVIQSTAAGILYMTEGL